MGLSADSTGIKASKTGLTVKKKAPQDKIIAIAGNPNVGKSTLFNALTGMKQHTGNWPGKTVTNAQGYFKTDKNSYVLVDIPGTYSLFAHSAEEKVARDFLCFGEPDAVIVVCDGTCLERNLNLVLQTMEIHKNVIVCVNLLDEAKRKGIKIELDRLSHRLGVPVVGTVARNKKSLKRLADTLDSIVDKAAHSHYRIRYPDIIEGAICTVETSLSGLNLKGLNTRWLSLKLLENDRRLLKEIEKYTALNITESPEVKKALEKAEEQLILNGVRNAKLKDMIASAIVVSAEEIAKNIIKTNKKGYNKTDRKIDALLTSKRFGYPVMILLLALIFWITITGANYISQLLSSFFSILEGYLSKLLINLNTPDTLYSIIIEGIYRVPVWVVSVMLPPMAIFFPLFTLLEDAGYLPRVAYNLDKPFKHCRSCGKQALTMCMGMFMVFQHPR